MEILDEPFEPKINPEQAKVFKFILYIIAVLILSLLVVVLFATFIGMAIDVGSQP